MADKLNGRYTLIRKVGSGTNGVTYLATDEKSESPVVIKRLRNELNASSREIWPREAAVLRGLEYPGIPDFIDFFEEEIQLETLPHIVQEYIPGTNLEEEIRNRKYTPREVLELLVELFEALVYLQSLSPPVLHRDIKPENIIRHQEGRLYLIDFGTATSVKGQTFGHTMVAGTLGYQSMEQIEGEPGLSSDLYSLGVIAVRLLTGRSIEELYVGMGTIRWKEYLPHAPVILIQFLEKLLATNTSDRYGDALHALEVARICIDRIDVPNSTLYPPDQTSPAKSNDLPLPKGSGGLSRFSYFGLLVVVLVACRFLWLKVEYPCTFGKDSCYDSCHLFKIEGGPLKRLRSCEVFLESYPDSESAKEANYHLCRSSYEPVKSIQYCELYKKNYPGDKSLGDIEFLLRKHNRNK